MVLFFNHPAGYPYDVKPNQTNKHKFITCLYFITCLHIHLEVEVISLDCIASSSCYVFVHVNPFTLDLSINLPLSVAYTSFVSDDHLKSMSDGVQMDGDVHHRCCYACSRELRVVTQVLFTILDPWYGAQ